MPGKNGNGPLGNGPKTGGQRGICKQTQIDKTNQLSESTGNIVPGQGLRVGRCQGGTGKGQGKGQGRGGNR